MPSVLLLRHLKMREEMKGVNGIIVLYVLFRDKKPLCRSFWFGQLETTFNDGKSSYSYYTMVVVEFTRLM